MPISGDRSGGWGFTMYSLVARPRRILITILVAIGAVLISTVGLSAPSDALPGWRTTAAVHNPDPSVHPIHITDVRVGHHPNFDRVVIDINGPLPGYKVRYVQKVIQDGSGNVVPLRGRYFIQVSIWPTSTVHHSPQGTWTPLFPMLRQVKGAGDFEGMTNYGLGLAGKKGFRVFGLSQPRRLVIDVRI